jgi:hypothetical protein
VSAKVSTRTRYSARIKGQASNWDLAAKFDMTAGHLGITNYDGPKVTNRVLLSPEQVRELKKFLRVKS